MTELSLTQLDANLLVALNILLEERSVSGAARRMSVSQPAMSQTLSRLRTLFDDPLLVRSGREMVPTPFADGLARRLHGLLGDLEALIREKPVFQPGEARMHFAIAALDYISSLFVPRLLRQINETAPGIDLVIRPLDKESFTQDLESGVLDGIIGVFPTSATNIESKVLFKERFVCVVRPDHPILENETINPSHYASWPHGLVDPRGNRAGAVDKALAREGLVRRIASSVPFFLSAGDIVESTDLIFTLPRRLGEYLARRQDLALFDPPVELPTFPIRLGWHIRLDADPANIWLRQMVIRSVG